MPEQLQSVRADKFLWSVRLFKTRSLAAEACDKHRVLVNNMEIKPSRGIKTGDKLTVKKLPAVYIYEVIHLVDKRQPASLVQNYISDITPKEYLDRAETAGMTAFAKRGRGAGRPTKKERRDMDKLTSL
jgi:ribosome-associated heat shock protein Hsp15